jgi:arylsulfatase A-like enzyme
MKSKIVFSLVIVLCLFNLSNLIAQNKPKPNVLFIAIDDLKPILGCYGDKMIKTPNIDRIAKNGTIFFANYCQQAVCGPTRASIMTGKRPDYTKIWDLKTKMRDMNPDILSIPQYFVSQGYSTQGVGKVYDIRCVDKDIDKPSWSVPYYKTDKNLYSKQTGEPANNQFQNPATKELAKKSLQEAYAKGLKGEAAITDASVRVKPSVESVDVPDDAYTDGVHAKMAKNILIGLSKKNEPFFLAVGFSKPHLPFVSPKKYWDLYDREKMPLAPFQQSTENAVPIAYHNVGELRAYTDIDPINTFTDQKPGLSLSVEKQKELIHGYYAAVSYTDAQLGIVLNALDSLGLTNNTIIILWGDHGWHLGDHNLWCKHSNFENAARAPLIISAPGIAASSVKSQTEFVDIFPTLCDLANLKIPANLDGKSLVPAMKKPATVIKEYSVSQYPRSGPASESERLGYADAEFMGYSIRTAQYRYTIWMKDRWRTSQVFNKDLIVGTELYDYQKDPLEKINVEGKKEYTVTLKQMQDYMKKYMDSEYKKFNKTK